LLGVKARRDLVMDEMEKRVAEDGEVLSGW
jgi:hypothetical protein